MLKRFIADESGAQAVEYGLIAGLIAVVIIAALTLLGETLKDTFNRITDAIKGAS